MTGSSPTGAYVLPRLRLSYIDIKNGQPEKFSFLIDLIIRTGAIVKDEIAAAVFLLVQQTGARIEDRAAINGGFFVIQLKGRLVE
nr:hypothetical protein [Neobacillus sp. Marseille-Q6967]